MATTFNVLFLGNLVDLDTNEGNYVAENADALVGMTFGSQDAPIQDSYYEFSKVSNQNGYYRTDNSGRGDTYDDFRVTAQDGTSYVLEMDSTVVYNATLTYMNGETAQITAVVFQDRYGNTFLAPEYSENQDQTYLEYRGIRMVTLDSLETDSSLGLNEDRQTFEFVTCFTKGTMILTSNGERPIEDLRPGDMIWTMDDGLQPLRWIGSKDVDGTGDLAPIEFAAGSLGSERVLKVSPNHRMYLFGASLALHLGEEDGLAMAKHMVNGADVRVAPQAKVTYMHMMFDRHQIVLANGVLAESFHPGDYAMTCLTDEARVEVLSLFPELVDRPAAYGTTARFVMKRHEVAAILRDVVATTPWKPSEFALAS